MSPLLRVLIGLSGLVLLMPEAAFGLGAWVDLVGFAAVVALMAFEYFGRPPVQPA